ncbi:MAG: sigma-70 family RNA polymerase sigma factor [Gemmatimonadota bacterium]|nr:sigma-70 family RNA polymerase sigma factor [Gemmatimonadota bacterium]
MRRDRVTEAELAALAHAGDAEAFGELVTRYAAQARRLARTILLDPDDADDAAQDGFLAAWRHLGRYDASRPFGPWLLRIVANAAADRRRRRRVRQTEELSPVAASGDAGPATETDRSALREAFEVALEELPERQRMAVVLFDVEGCSHAEIAAVLGIPEGTVRSDVFHARRALRGPLAAWRGWKESEA